MTVSRGHIDDGGGPFLVLEGDVSKATMVEVRQGSHIVARRIRSVHPPAVRILTPSPINGSRWIPIRWSARDRDGGRLSVVLDYSYDAGKTWRTIFIGPNRGRIRLPTSYFSASHKAQIRLRVNDGFNDATAVSAEFTAPGRPPSATIVSPSPATSVLDSSSVYLEGSATDDRLRPIAGSRLAWYAAGRKLGIGPAPSVLLPAGRDRVTLVATDSLGRRGSASVFVRVMPTRPAFLRLDAPTRVSPAARHLTLVVAASLRSRLAISGAGVVGARYDVGPVPRSLRVALRPGQRSLGLRLVLSAGGRSTALVVPIAR